MSTVAPTYRRLLVAGLAAVALAAGALAGCGAPPPPAAPAAEVAAEPQRPADEQELATGTHLFPDLLPGELGVEIDVVDAGIVPFSAPQFVFLGDSEGIDVVTFMDADASQLLADPMTLPPIEAMAVPDDYVVDVPPGELLDRLAALPFLEVTAPERPVTVGGVSGTAIDVAVPEFPEGTAPCAPDLPPCAGVVAVPENLYFVVPGQELRISVLDHPAGRVLVLESLQEPRAQTVLDATRFVAG